MSITTTITGTTEQVTLDSEGLWVNPTSIDVTNSTVTSETITSNGTATNYTHLFNSGGNVNVLTITGNTFFSDDRTDGSFVSQLNSINASPDTGGIDIDTSLGILKSTFTFTGGSGVSILSISKASLDGLNAGFQLNGGLATSGNVLGIGGLSTLTGTSASIGEYKSLNATKGFQILGVGGTGNNVVINDAFLTNGFATHVVDGQDGGSFTVTNIGKTYTLDIFNNGYINPPQVSYNLSSAAATQTALTINLIPNWGPLPEQSPSPLAGLNVGKVTTTGGISSVALVSNIATSVNIINTYHGSDNQTLTITGNEAFAILGMTPNTTKGDTINASGFTQDLTLGTIGGTNTVATRAGDTGKGDVITLGSGTSYLAVSSVVTGDKITLLAGHTATDTIDTTLIASSIAGTPYTTAAAQKADITQITNFNTNSDILKIGEGISVPQNGTSTDLTGHTWLVTNGFVTSSGMTGAAGLSAFLADVAASTSFAANDVLAYNDGTNTYIAVGDHAAGTLRGENIIELVGLHAATDLGNAGGANTIDIEGSAIPLQATLTLNGVGLWYDQANVDLTNDAQITSGTIFSTSGANYVHLTNTGRAVTSLIFNGTAHLDLSVDSTFSTQLDSINASNDKGDVIVSFEGTLKPGFTFTGGSGINALVINKTSLDELTAGSQLNGGTATSGNILGVFDIGTLTGISAVTGEYKTLNATKGFQILGVLGIGNTVMINDAFLTNKGFATHILDGQDGGSLTVTNVGSTYTLDIVHADPRYTPNPNDFTISAAVAIKTALTVNLTPSFLTPVLLSGLTEGTFTTTGGISSVTLVSNAATSANKINTYHGSDNQTLTITGNEAFAILGMTPNTTKGDTINASGFTQDLTLGTIGGTNTVATRAGDTGKGDVITLGSGTSYLAVSSTVTGDKITLLAGHTATDTIDTTLIAYKIAHTAYISAAAQKTDITQITNFNTNSDILNVGITGGSTGPQIGTSSDLNANGHTWTITNGFATRAGSTGATGLVTFLADVAASTSFTANDVLAYNDGTNTYIAIGDHTNTVRGEHIIELVGLHNGTALGLAGGATTIHLA